MRLYNPDLYDRIKAWELANNGVRLFECVCVHLPYSKILSTWQIEEELYGCGRYASVGYELELPPRIQELLHLATYKASFQQLVTDEISHAHLLSYCDEQGLSAPDTGVLHVGNTYELPDNSNQVLYPMKGDEVLIQLDD